MAGITPTSRTLEYIREHGWLAAKVEIWNPYAGQHGQRRDMFGFADIVALGEGRIIAIQSCGEAFSAHHHKLTEDEYAAPNAMRWLECGGRLILIGWRKVLVKRGGKAMRWAPRIREYTLDDFRELRDKTPGQIFIPTDPLCSVEDSEDGQEA